MDDALHVQDPAEDEQDKDVLAEPADNTETGSVAPLPHSSGEATRGSADITPGRKEGSQDSNASDSKSSSLSSSIPPSLSSSTGLSEISRETRPGGGEGDGHDAPPSGSTPSTSESSLLPPNPSPTSDAQLKSTAPASTLTLEREVTDYAALSNRVKPRSSIPARIPSSVYGQQCVESAYISRLNPYSLHKGEQELLQDHLCHLHVTAYLNIRNGILRLWSRNPMLSVTEDEALGCAKDSRWMPLASVAYNWLVRNGYINFGCIDIPKCPSTQKRGRRRDGPTIAIVGALQGLFQHYYGGSVTPKIILLEGRKRIGGRIYSHPLRSLETTELPEGLRPTAEMGAHIIVGFDHGNPLDPIIRAQLALRYHLLRDISTIYDTNGLPVDEMRDSMTEKLYNDILDRSGTYRHKSVAIPTAEGDRELIDSGRDTSADDGITIREYEDAAASGTTGTLLPAARLRRGVGHKTTDIKPAAGPALSELQPTKEHSAATTCQAMGWKLRNNVSTADSLSLDEIANASSTQSLGAVMDDAINQYQKLLDLTPQDMRLLNWHFANLEYANAASVGKLSLSGWDQDMGNEFEGEHAQVVGGYQQLPRGLWSLPSKLDVRTKKTVSKIWYNADSTSNEKTRVECEDGETIYADKVVFTAPLGVLKRSSVAFNPALPEWKTNAIKRLGFGLLNKVILVFKEPFWDMQRDMFGLLREPTVENSMLQDDYRANRGQFYLFWNCMATCGLPMLIALMAGESAHEAEKLSDEEIIKGVTSQLRNIFKDKAVPDPLETIVTRWGQDKFAQGSYSYVAAEALPGDYDAMAKSIGTLYFAGEATCGTHPATVHGAYLSGLRAASEVIESYLGPIDIPSPLVPAKNKASNNASMPTTPTSASPQKKRKPVSAPNGVSHESLSAAAAPASEDVLRQAYDEAMWAAIISELGPAEPRPRKLALNPFLLYQKDYWYVCKTECDNAKIKATGKENAKAPRDEIRQALGQMWRDEVRRSRSHI
ncbi:lysine-specific histone demethylase 1 [Nannizzia gypsea CBS 118893]|uniref:Lysine-specific histone demethylase 1 n=1 Tax=Arthroderma gypseum (strain ATCC MYA-4604 / CBS 118893) TaxID=535722 RepID=E5R254_ARTGP|nr:lysine-specific histone demethylase 1 [Nannizzia gypsea CBS 118893]EFQ98618.1 lysine-specific histone demethylase 1 [Nannizzia gypsea CBS 118893]